MDQIKVVGKPKVSRVIIELEVDEFANVDQLGKQTNEDPGPLLQEGLAFDRFEGGTLDISEVRYFVCPIKATERAKDLILLGHSKEVAWSLAKKRCKDDYTRAESFGKDWHKLIVIARAQVVYDIGNRGLKRYDWLCSIGSRAIESDSEKDYLHFMVKKQIDELEQHLKVFGVDLQGFEDLAIDAWTALQLVTTS